LSPCWQDVKRSQHCGLLVIMRLVMQSSLM
jgi:hypothetical protein